MEERMRDVSLIRRNSYKNFVLDLYKSNYNLYENDKFGGMERIIGINYIILSTLYKRKKITIVIFYFSIMKL